MCRLECSRARVILICAYLFLIFVNDIVHCSDKLKFILFADDTNIYLQGKDLLEVKSVLNRELTKVLNWIKVNKLTLNSSKTHYMISPSPRNLTAEISIEMDGKSLTQVNEAKFLGVTIDSNLLWKSQLNYIETTMSKLTGIIYKIRNQLNINSLKMIYFSLAYPYLLYGSTAWGGAYKTYLDRLFVMQKKLIRSMTHSRLYDHTTPLFHELKLLKLHDIVHIQSSIFVYNALNTFTIDCGFQHTRQNFDTRRPNDLRLPLCRTSHAQKSILVRGVRCWNQLSDEIKTSNTRTSFKYKLKQQLLNNYS